MYAQGYLFADYLIAQLAMTILRKNFNLFRKYLPQQNKCSN